MQLGATPTGLPVMVLQLTAEEGGPNGSKMEVATNRSSAPGGGEGPRARAPKRTRGAQVDEFEAQNPSSAYARSGAKEG